VAGGREERVTLAVAFERRAATLPAPAVGLHEHALLPKDEVDLEGFDVLVDLRLRQAGLAAELQEALLEL
jgi:hypothetical protein